MALSGLLMCLFLIGHLSGNLLMYVGRDAFNAYADLLNSTKLIFLAEAGLVLILLVHVITAVQLTKENRAAKPNKYHVKATGGRRTLASSHMLHTGVIILLFLIIHIVTLKFGNWSNAPESGNTLYDLVLDRFSSKTYSGFYLVAMLMLAFHLNHSINSACVTLGLSNSSCYTLIKRIGLIFSIVIGVGFASFPAYFYLQSI